MGKQGKPKGNILALLPRAAPPVSFISPPPSPVRANSGKAASGPVVSLVPKEARRKVRSLSFDAREPTSPKVSCIGQVKNKKKKKKMKMMMMRRGKEITRMVSYPKVIMKMFMGRKPVGKSDAANVFDEKTVVAKRAVPRPQLGQMKQFTSGRGVLSDFDWKATDAAKGESDCC